MTDLGKIRTLKSKFTKGYAVLMRPVNPIKVYKSFLALSCLVFYVQVVIEILSEMKKIGMIDGRFLLCQVQVEDPKDIYHSEDDRNHIYLFQSYNFTLRIHWAPYLVRVEDKLYTWPDNKTEIVTHVYLDELAEVWVKAAVGADILQLSAGHHAIHSLCFLPGCVTTCNLA